MILALLFGATQVQIPRSLRISAVVDRVERSDPLAMFPDLNPWFSCWRIPHTDELRTPFGRRVHSGGAIAVPKQINYLAQGLEADGLKSALALLWERRADCPAAFPILTAHDEIVVEAPAEEANVASEWLARCMTDAMAPLLHPVPVGSLCPRIVQSWGD